jgi:hypothetical protein
MSGFVSLGMLRTSSGSAKLTAPQLYCFVATNLPSIAGIGMILTRTRGANSSFDGDSCPAARHANSKAKTNQIVESFFIAHPVKSLETHFPNAALQVNRRPRPPRKRERCRLGALISYTCRFHKATEVLPKKWQGQRRNTSQPDDLRHRYRLLWEYVYEGPACSSGGLVATNPLYSIRS